MRLCGGRVGAVEPETIFFSEAHFGVHGVETPEEDFLLERGDLVRGVV